MYQHEPLPKMNDWLQFLANLHHNVFSSDKGKALGVVYNEESRQCKIYQNYMKYRGKKAWYKSSFNEKSFIVETTLGLIHIHCGSADSGSFIVGPWEIRIVLPETVQFSICFTLHVIWRLRRR